MKTKIKVSPLRPIVRLTAYELASLTNYHGGYIVERVCESNGILGAQYYYRVWLDKLSDLYGCGLPASAVERILADAETK